MSGDIDGAVRRPRELAFVHEVQRDAAVATADLEDVAHLETGRKAGPERRHLRGHRRVLLVATAAPADRRGDVILGSLLLPAIAVLLPDRSDGRNPSPATSSLSGRGWHGAAARTLSSGAPTLGVRSELCSSDVHQPVDAAEPALAVLGVPGDRAQDAFLPRHERLPAGLAVQLLVADPQRHHVGHAGAQAACVVTISRSSGQ